MCSNMWARPVFPMGSCAEPASTSVKKEKTGASGRSQIRMVKPFGSVLTVMRFSKDATSWAAATVVRSRISAKGRNTWFFIRPPKGIRWFGRRWDDHVLDEQEGQKFEITWGAGKLSIRLQTESARKRRDRPVFCVRRDFVHN